MAAVLAISSSKVGSLSRRGIQSAACILYDTQRKSAEKDAVTDCDSLQAFENRLYDSEEGNGL